MKILTEQLGELEINEENIINFEHGLPGFLSLRSFVIINPDLDAKEGMFSYLQSVDKHDVCFVLMNAQQFISGYEPLVDEEVLTDLGDFEDEDLLVYNIVNIPQNIKEMTVNLKAPVIISSSTKKGKQVVALNEDYLVKHKVFDDISEAGEN
jgi:flagellar assembly factor FliW